MRFVWGLLAGMLATIILPDWFAFFAVLITVGVAFFVTRTMGDDTA